MNPLSPLSVDGPHPPTRISSGSSESSLPSRNTAALKNDDDAFITIATALLERHKNKNLTVDMAINATLMSHERQAFGEALHFRKSRLPMFPEANEDSINQVVRDVERIFGSVLRTSTNMASPTNHDTRQWESELNRLKIDADTKSTKIHVESSSNEYPFQAKHSMQPNLLDHNRTTRPIIASDDFYPPSTSASDNFHPPSTSFQQQPQPQQEFQTSQQQSQQQYHQQVHHHYEPQLRQQYQPQLQFQPQQQYMPRHQQQYQPHLAYQYPFSHDDQDFPVDEASSPRDSCSTNSNLPPPVQRKGSNTSSVDTQRVHNLNPRSLRHQRMEGYQQFSEYPHHQQRLQHHPTSTPLMETQHESFDDTPTPPPRPTTPLYKQHRPPKLKINPIATSSPPPQIDIDWNIPIHVITDSEPSKVQKQVTPPLPTPPITIPMDEAPTKVEDALVIEKSNEEARKDYKEELAPVKESEETQKSEQQNTDVTAQVGHAVSFDYRMDIALNKSALVFNPTDTVEKQIEFRRKLLAEIDRIKAKLGTTVLDTKEQKAYQTYLSELRVELEKWNVASDFGTSVIEKDPNDSLIGETLEIYDTKHTSKHYSFSSERFPLPTPPSTDQDSDEKVPRKSGRTSPKRRNQPVRSPKNDPALSEDEPVKQLRMVNVVAPHNLPGGFQFEARVGDEIFMATVPKGGVTQGEVFATGMGDIIGGGDGRTRVFRDMDAPNYRWRDRFFDCFRYGICHPFLWTSLFCPQVALSQIMARIRLGDTGEVRHTVKSRARACWYVLLAILFLALHAIYALYLTTTQPSSSDMVIITCPLLGLDIIVISYFLFLMSKTRRLIREEYRIRGKGECEDCCLSTWCTCCTLAQMGSHTADYETFVSYCCTDTGLAHHIEVKLPYETKGDIEAGMKKSNQPSYRQMNSP